MRRFEPVAALGGALLAASLFAPWYRPDAFIITRDSGGSVTQSLLSIATFSGWRSFTVIDVLLTLVSALAILTLVVKLRVQVVATLAGVALVVFALLDPPFAGVTIRPGALVGLAGALLAFTGTWLSAREASGSSPPAGDRALVLVGGIVLLVSLFLTWYDVSDAERDRTFPVPDYLERLDAAATGWQWFAVTDLLLAGAGLLAVAAALSRRPALALGATVSCALLLPWVLYRVLEQPGPLYVDGFGLAMEPRIGAWLGLAGVLIAAVGSWLRLRTDPEPGAEAAEAARRSAPSAASA